MEFIKHSGHVIEFESQSEHRLPFRASEYWFNVSDEQGEAFRLAMRVHTNPAQKFDPLEVARDVGLSFTKGLIDHGYERVREYREERKPGWRDDWNDAAYSDDDLQVELLISLRRLKRSNDKSGVIGSLHVPGVAAVLGVSLNRLLDALSDLLTMGLAQPSFPTLTESPLQGAVTISSAGNCCAWRV
jgi:hypothetical protein